MPKREKIATLPPEIRAWLEAELVKRGFGGYQQLEQLILAEHGVKIDHSTIARYGQKLERKLAAIRASTEAARSIAQAAPDDADLRSAAVMSLVQTEIFEVLVNLQEASDEDVDQVTRVKLLSQAAKNIATLSRASVNQKKWQAEVAARTELAANRIADIAKKGGMSDEAIITIREAIAGIVQ